MVHTSTGRQCGYDTTVRTVLMYQSSFLFLLIELYSILCLFLVQTVGCLTRGGLQYPYMFRICIRIIMESSTHTPRR